MQKQPSYSASRELVFIVACFCVMGFSITQTLLAVKFTAIGLSLLIISAVMLVLLRRRVVAAWRGATGALSDARIVTLKQLDEENSQARQAGTGK